VHPRCLLVQHHCLFSCVNTSRERQLKGSGDAVGKDSEVGLAVLFCNRQSTTCLKVLSLRAILQASSVAQTHDRSREPRPGQVHGECCNASSPSADARGVEPSVGTSMLPVVATAATAAWLSLLAEASPEGVEAPGNAVTLTTVPLLPVVPPVAVLLSLLLPAVPRSTRARRPAKQRARKTANKPEARTTQGRRRMPA